MAAVDTTISAPRTVVPMQSIRDFTKGAKCNVSQGAVLLLGAFCELAMDTIHSATNQVEKDALAKKSGSADKVARTNHKMTTMGAKSTCFGVHARSIRIAKPRSRKAPKARGAVGA
jgi:transcription antitermination factor NusA-like protein